MYDMYPDRWATDDRPTREVSERPRRRVRKAHRIQPDRISPAAARRRQQRHPATP